MFNCNLPGSHERYTSNWSQRLEADTGQHCERIPEAEYRRNLDESKASNLSVSLRQTIRTCRKWMLKWQPQRVTIAASRR